VRPGERYPIVGPHRNAKTGAAHACPVASLRWQRPIHSRVVRAWQQISVRGQRWRRLTVLARGIDSGGGRFIGLPDCQSAGSPGGGAINRFGG